MLLCEEIVNYFPYLVQHNPSGQTLNYFSNTKIKCYGYQSNYCGGFLLDYFSQNRCSRKRGFKHKVRKVVKFAKPKSLL